MKNQASTQKNHKENEIHTSLQEPAQEKKNEVDVTALGFGETTTTDEEAPANSALQRRQQLGAKVTIVMQQVLQQVKELWHKLRGNSIRLGGSNKRFYQFLKENKKTLLKIAVLVFAVLGVIMLAIWYVSNDNNYTLPDGTVQYYAGQSYEITSGATLVRSLDEVTTLTKINSDDRTVTSLVFYQPEEDTMVLPQSMVYYDPRSDYYECIDALSVISYEGNSLVAQKDGDTVNLNKGFLYDGGDYYVFLEEVTVRVNGYSIELSAFSYIEAIYQNYVVVFDYDSKESFVETLSTEVVVTTPTEDYTLSLINDLIEYYDGQKALLFTRPELLTSIFD